MIMKYDLLVVGAGLFGSVTAQKAREAGKKVLVLERRPHIAGNIYTEEIAGIHVHKYGPHIFHTNNKKVWDYIRQFADFNEFINSPIANYMGELYSLPFNMNTFKEMWGCSTPEEAFHKIEEQRKEALADILSKRGVSLETFKPANLEEQALFSVGYDIYEKLIKGYTEKQWGRKCNELPADIIKRLPIRFTYDNNYYDSIYQGIPVGGYTKLIEKMLSGVEVKTGVDYLKERDCWNSMAERIVYTGPIDAYFDYSLGKLEYRSVRFETETLDISDYQGNAVVNYTDSDTPWTRIVEHKWFQFGKDDLGRDISKTIISKEFSQECKAGEEPYYPVNDEKNTRLYNSYKELAGQEEKVSFCGRLGEFKYYDMDKTIELALSPFN